MRSMFLRGPRCSSFVTRAMPHGQEIGVSPPRASESTVEALERSDLTGVTSWHASDLTRDTLQVRITHASSAGAGNLTMDFIGMTVGWRSYWHLMGTDAIGRDVFSRTLYGTRTSLVIMIIAVATAFIVGFPIGLYSGYRGGSFDKVLVLVMDSLYAFPGLLFAGLIAVLLGK